MKTDRHGPQFICTPVRARFSAGLGRRVKSSKTRSAWTCAETGDESVRLSRTGRESPVAKRMTPCKSEGGERSEGTARRGLAP
eukprot:3939491-Rhodomonas_salina.2